MPVAESGTDYVPAEPDRAYSGEYPLARFLYLYVNAKPNTELDPLRREFVKYVLSANGQRDVIKDGYLPLAAAAASNALASVGIGADT